MERQERLEVNVRKPPLEPWAKSHAAAKKKKKRKPKKKKGGAGGSKTQTSPPRVPV